MSRRLLLQLSGRILPSVLVATGAGSCWGQVPASPALRESQFPPLQRKVLVALGDRLQKPGKEAMILNSIYDEFSGGQKTSSSAVNITLQYPGLVRMDYSGSSDSVVFDGNSVSRRSSQASQRDKDLVESVVKDSSDDFLLGRLAGSSVRLIGPNYIIKDPRTTDHLANQCDLFSVNEVNGLRGKGSNTQKIYCFDPLNGYLRLVLYKTGSNVIETRYSGWQRFGGEAIPSSVQRWSNSTQVLGLTILQASFGHRRGVFLRPALVGVV